MHSDHDRALSTIRMVLAADCACEEDDFDRDGLTVVPTAERRARRRFPLLSRGLLIVTMGAGVVVSCHPERIVWIRSTFAGKDRDAIFSISMLARVSSYVARERQCLDGPGLRFACSVDRFRPAHEPSDIEIKIVETHDLGALYHHPGFQNALAYRHNGRRPDMVAAVALHDGKIVGIAAASADSDTLWQIGVDVIELERRTGIGRALVSRVTSAVLDRGKIPYYSSAVSNIASRSLAIGLGYWPAWTEVYVRDAPKATEESEPSPNREG